MNSVLQVLMSQPEYQEKYAKNAREEISAIDSFGSAPENEKIQWLKLADGMCSGNYSQKLVADKTEEEIKANAPDEFYQNGVRPQMFKTLIGRGHPEF